MKHEKGVGVFVIPLNQPVSGDAAKKRLDFDQSGIITTIDVGRHVEADTIVFDSGVFPSGTPATIALSTALPALSTHNDTIDGTGAGVIVDAVNVEPGPAFYNCSSRLHRVGLSPHTAQDGLYLLTTLVGATTRSRHRRVPSENEISTL